MKRLKVLIVVGGLMAGAAITGAAAFVSGSKLSQNDGASCPATYAHYEVVIQGGSIQPKHITATLCDTLTVTNKDMQHRLMAFGKHDEHQEYNGITERQLTKDQSYTVKLTKAGTYTLHDHLDDNIKASFTVTP